jgi:DNA-binding response OmpR family regulator
MKKALIVDDDPDLRSEIGNCLGSFGWSSVQSGLADVQASLESGDARDSALVFIPARAGDFAGIAESVRVHAPESLIIAMADLDGKKELRAALESGLVDDFLPIPFSPSDLRGIYKLVGVNGI